MGTPRSNLTNVQSSQAGSYIVTVTDPYNSASWATSLTVVAVPPVLLADIRPVAGPSWRGNSLTYSVMSQGTPPLFYQWVLNGSSIAGATNVSYSFIALGGSNAYSVVITNSYGSTNSSTATVVGVSAL